MPLTAAQEVTDATQPAVIIKRKRLPWQRISSKDILFLTQQLEIMVHAGVPLTKTLETLQVQTKNKYLHFVLESVSADIQQGKTLADALTSFQKDFGELMINMIAAGEASGRLDEVLAQLYLQMKKDHEIVARVRGALIYPAIVVAAMFGIGTFMIVFIVPKLTSLFTEMSVTLPLPTRILIGMSNFLTNHGLLAVGLFVGFIIAFTWTIHQPWGKKGWHKLLLYTPIVGPIIKKVNVARFARTVSSFLKTDIPVVKTLQTTAHVLGNVYYKEALLDAAEKITKGITVEEALRPHSALFNPTILQMISVGEQAGSLDDMLAEAAGFYESEVNQTMETLPSLLEPILMLLLGFGVGGMAVAIILPLYTLTQAF
ncbi:MAG: type II secretion system F family protein [Patescibacteria group bacterium]|jgi:type IV pilus assembly protein PilC